MGLSNIKLQSSDPDMQALLTKSVGEAEFKLLSNASKATSRDILGWKNRHYLDNGSIGLKAYCKTCGQIEPETGLSDEKGQIVKVPDTKAGVFEVTDVTEIAYVNFEWVDKTYFVSPKHDNVAGANLVLALRKQALIGYVRLTSTGDERPAVLYAPNDETLVMQTLFFSDETVAGIPLIVGKPDSTGEEMRDFIQTRSSSMETIHPAEVKRREVEELKGYQSNQQETKGQAV